MGFYTDTRVFKCLNTEGFKYGHPEVMVELYQTDQSLEGCDVDQNGDSRVYVIPKRVFDKYFAPAPMPKEPTQ